MEILAIALGGIGDEVSCDDAESLPLGPQGKGYLVLDVGESGDKNPWVCACYIIDTVLRILARFRKRVSAGRSDTS